MILSLVNENPKVNWIPCIWALVNFFHNFVILFLYKIFFIWNTQIYILLFSVKSIYYKINTKRNMANIDFKKPISYTSEQLEQYRSEEILEY